MHPLLSLVCGRKLSDASDVLSCMDQLAKHDASSQREAAERRYAREIDAGRLTVYSADDFRGDLCSLLPEGKCLDQGRGKSIRCAWNALGGETSARATCGALMEASAGQTDFDVWTSHIRDNPFSYPFEDQASVSPPVAKPPFHSAFPRLNAWSS